MTEELNMALTWFFLDMSILDCVQDIYILMGRQEKNVREFSEGRGIILKWTEWL